ncbi:MAG: hypothetical protein WD002_11890 [Pseudomonadales bacterium]
MAPFEIAGHGDLDAIRTGEEEGDGFEVASAMDGPWMAHRRRKAISRLFTRASYEDSQFELSHYHPVALTSVLIQSRLFSRFADTGKIQVQSSEIPP